LNSRIKMKETRSTTPGWPGCPFSNISQALSRSSSVETMTQPALNMSRRNDITDGRKRDLAAAFAHSISTKSEVKRRTRLVSMDEKIGFANACHWSRASHKANKPAVSRKADLMVDAHYVAQHDCRAMLGHQNFGLKSHTLSSCLSTRLSAIAALASFLFF